MADPGPSRSFQSRPSQSRLEVEVIRKAALWDRIPLDDAELARAAEAAFEAAPQVGSGPCEVTIVLTDDAEIRDLNRTWRGKDAPTNVLSFPAGEMRAGAEEALPLGDIVLAAEQTGAEAEVLGVPIQDHVLHLVVHAMLHLLGFDHEEEDAAERMESLETQILGGLGIADPYTRSDDSYVAETSS